MSKQIKSLSQQLREERERIESSAIANTEEEEIKRKRKWKYSTAKMIDNTLERVNKLISGEIKSPIVKKKFIENGKPGPKPKEENKNLARFHHGMDKALASKMREFSKKNGVSVRKIVEEGIKLYFLKLEHEK